MDVRQTFLSTYSVISSLEILHSSIINHSNKTCPSSELLIDLNIEPY